MSSTASIPVTVILQTQMMRTSWVLDPPLLGLLKKIIRLSMQEEQRAIEDGANNEAHKSFAL